MHPERGIDHTDRQWDGMSMITDVPNTLTCQPAGTNGSPRELSSWPH